MPLSSIAILLKPDLEDIEGAVVLVVLQPPEQLQRGALLQRMAVFAGKEHHVGLSLAVLCRLFSTLCERM